MIFANTGLDEIQQDSTESEGESQDTEHGLPRFKRFILHTDGLKCSGSGIVISRAIERIPAIEEFHVNIVQARVDIKLDQHRLSVADAILRLSKFTGYTFTDHIRQEGQVLEVLTAQSSRIQGAELPDGVYRVRIMDKGPWRPSKLLSPPLIHKEPSADKNNIFFPENERITYGKIHSDEKLVHIDYDASQIGARHVFRYYQNFDPCLKLAPPTADYANLFPGYQHVKHALYMFFPSFILTIPVLLLA